MVCRLTIINISDILYVLNATIYFCNKVLDLVLHVNKPLYYIANK